MLARLERWGLDSNLLTAAEVVETAIVEGLHQEGVLAAQKLLKADLTPTPLIREQAIKLLERAGQPASELSNNIGGEQSVRMRVRSNARDPLSWVELSLAQTTSGSSAAALRSMTIALALAPDNRHVLRSAARLFLHLNDPQRAHDTIYGSPVTRTDPWLIAAEIALASVADRRPKLIKAGIVMLEQRSFLPRHITELAASVATQELESGNRKRAKKHFQQSLINPNGNALAQGEWVTPHIGVELVSGETLFSTFEPSEAIAFNRYRTGDFINVAPACFAWAAGDPFSAEPYELGATVAGMSDDYGSAIELARKGLAFRPHSQVLLNALAYALGSRGETDAAGIVLDSINHQDSSGIQAAVTSANRGLLSFRRNDVAGGDRHYNNALQIFTKLRRPDLVAQARAYWARESLLSGRAGWQEIFAQARAELLKIGSNESRMLLDKLSTQQNAAGNIADSTILSIQTSDIAWSMRVAGPLTTAIRLGRDNYRVYYRM